MKKYFAEIKEILYNISKNLENRYSPVSPIFSGIRDVLDDYSILRFVNPIAKSVKLHLLASRATYVSVSLPNSSSFINLSFNSPTKEPVKFMDGSFIRGIFNEIYITYDFTDTPEYIEGLEIFIGYNSEYRPIQTVRLADVSTEKPLPVDIKSSDILTAMLATLQEINNAVNPPFTWTVIPNTMVGDVLDIKFVNSSYYVKTSTGLYISTDLVVFNLIYTWQNNVERDTLTYKSSNIAGFYFLRTNGTTPPPNYTTNFYLVRANLDFTTITNVSGNLFATNIESPNFVLQARLFHSFGATYFSAYIFDSTTNILKVASVSDTGIIPLLANSTYNVSGTKLVDVISNYSSNFNSLDASNLKIATDLIYMEFSHTGNNQLSRIVSIPLSNEITTAFSFGQLFRMVGNILAQYLELNNNWVLENPTVDVLVRLLNMYDASLPIASNSGYSFLASSTKIYRYKASDTSHIQVETAKPIALENSGFNELSSITNIVLANGIWICCGTNGNLSRRT